jgi:hypothetical protein
MIFQDSIAEDFSILSKHDTLQLPTSLELFISDEHYALRILPTLHDPDNKFDNAPDHTNAIIQTIRVCIL